MPAWSGRWKGGRYYLDPEGKKVFFIERRGRSVKLATHDEDLAVGELARFLVDPAAFCRPPPMVDNGPVLITKERLTLYMESIHHTVEDHRKARRSYLHAWAELGLDLRTVDRKGLRAGLASFAGGHAGRTEALNAFARFLVREGDLVAWNPLVNTRAPEATRADREAYGLEQLHVAFKRIPAGTVRDLFHLRAATGLHHTEIEQLEGAEVITGPLPDRGTWIRKLDGKHEIAAVLQVVHKKKSKVERRHRVSIDATTLGVVERLRAHVPDRVTVWEALDPIVPSNLRHTFVTLAGEVGKLVTYSAGGVDRARIAQAVGHRAGSTMTADRYDKLQVPPMITIPLPWVEPVKSVKAERRKSRTPRGSAGGLDVEPQG